MENIVMPENFGTPMFMMDENGEVFISDDFNLGHIIILYDIVRQMVKQLSTIKLGGKKA